MSGSQERLPVSGVFGNGAKACLPRQLFWPNFCALFRLMLLNKTGRK